MNKKPRPGKKRGGPLGPHADRAGGPPRGLAAQIVRTRLRRGLSQEAAAAEMDIARVTLAGWELGTQPRGLYLVALRAWLTGRA